VSIVAEEVNVKAVEFGKAVKLDTKITPELKAEGMMRDVVRLVQAARKEAGLQVDDRIRLVLRAGGELRAAVEVHADVIKAETLAVELTMAEGAGAGVPAKVDGQELYVELEKA